MDHKKWIAALAGIKGIDAIVLGGSKSRGEDDIHSDTDIGLYYQSEIDWLEVENVLRVLMDETHLHEKVLYLPGEWGPWVNGGAWLKVDGEPVDIILRETKRTEAVIEACLNGEITVEHQTGHPFGFVNTIYAAEVHEANILWESENLPITNLKEKLFVDGMLPEKTKQAIIERFLFEATFIMESIRKSAKRDDVHYTLGCFFRVVGCWNHILYALNNRYMMNEKKSLPIANRLPIRPIAYLVRINQTYEYFATHRHALAVDEYEGMQEDINNLVKRYHEMKQN